MSGPSDPQAAALLAHVVSQMQQNVDFLVSQNYITSADASAIVARLPVTRKNEILPGANAVSHSAPPTRRSVPQPPQPPRNGVVQARALWDYNEDRKEPNDLSFSEGDIIEIVEETNEDWWLGKLNGRQAIFPSSYVEKILQDDPAPNPKDDKLKPGTYASKSYGYPMPPVPAPEVTAADTQPAPEKKKGFGKYKNTLAHSAAGGVGFGAGAAIGGGLVRAIF